MFQKSLKTNSQLPFYKQMITVVQHISLCIIENWSSVTSFSQRRDADRLERRIQSQLCVQQTLKTLSLYLLEEIWTTWFCDNFWVWDNKESKKLKRKKTRYHKAMQPKYLICGWFVIPSSWAAEMLMDQRQKLLRCFCKRLIHCSDSDETQESAKPQKKWFLSAEEGFCSRRYNFGQT